MSNTRANWPSLTPGDLWDVIVLKGNTCMWEELNYMCLMTIWPLNPLVHLTSGSQLLKMDSGNFMENILIVAKGCKRTPVFCVSAFFIPCFSILWTPIFQKVELLSQQTTEYFPKYCEGHSDVFWQKWDKLFFVLSGFGGGTLPWRPVFPYSVLWWRHKHSP